jgi:hypothetical protein
MISVNLPDENLFGRGGHTDSITLRSIYGER